MRRLPSLLLTALLLAALLLGACSADDIGIAPSPPRPAVRLKVSWDGDEVSVVRKYVESHDLQVTLGPCGGNSLTQLLRLTYIPNLADTLAPTGSGGPTYHSATDWVGPYWMTATSGGNGNSGFTGGWHAYNGDFTGTPTARTASVSVFADGQQLQASHQDQTCEDVRVVVVNYLQAGNTKEADGSGREVLRETVTYHFRADTVGVSVVSEALEALTIDNYYGLQACFGGTVRMYCADSVFTCRTDGYHGPMSRVSAMDCTMDDGHQVRCYLDSVGLGTQDRYNRCDTDIDRQYCFTSPYGKAYFRLVGEVGLPLTQGQSTFWSGGYIFREATPSIAQ